VEQLIQKLHECISEVQAAFQKIAEVERKLSERENILFENNASIAPKLKELAERETLVAKIEHTETLIRKNEEAERLNQEEIGRLKDERSKFEIYIQGEKGWVNEQKRSIAEAWKQLGR
jgi:predicted RND superfamily exporter protein